MNNDTISNIGQQRICILFAEDVWNDVISVFNSVL